MSKAFKHLVWFKKDLRVTDHRALFSACKSEGGVAAVFIIEDEWLKSFECSSFHKNFLKQSLIDLNINLKKMNIPFFIKYGESVSVIKELKKQYSFEELWSHEETGLNWTFQRDKRIEQWCRDSSTKWSECRQFGVVRGKPDRNKWAFNRSVLIERKAFSSPGVQPVIDISTDQEGLAYLGCRGEAVSSFEGGSSEAWKVLNSFF